MPSVFQWTKVNPLAEVRQRRLEHRRQQLVKVIQPVTHDNETADCMIMTDNQYFFPDEISDVTIEIGLQSFDPALQDNFTDMQVEIEMNTEQENNSADEGRLLAKEKQHTSVATQTLDSPPFTVERFVEDDDGIHYYTGLENYQKFQFVLSTLGNAAYNLKYRWKGCKKLTVTDQFFLTLIKLRVHPPNFELSRMFNISESTVANIFHTWICFLACQWRELNIWPSRELINFFMPADFKALFPSTRVIVDGLECPIKKPKDAISQQVTFSQYKNRNTVKALVGASPGGLVTFVSNAYGGSASDRQIIERSNLMRMCNANDSVMADKGFNVQDIFAPFNIHVNIPTFLKNHNQFDGTTLSRDRKIASKRVHIERIIGLAKTYKILCHPLNEGETQLGSHVLFVCFMLCNFRSCIVPVTA